MDNRQKNTYAKKQITTALLKLLEKNALDDIPISQIAELACVSRMTFYRNYKSKAEVLSQHMARLIHDFYSEYLNCGRRSEEYFYGSLFGHFKKNQSFYLQLFKNGLDNIVLECIVDIAGAKPEFENIKAYRQEFFAYGLFGWIKEWVTRGMQEDTETMELLLKENGGTLI